MKYIEFDSSAGAFRWENYFEYLKTVEHRLPPSLRSYATEWEHYSLQGADTLHDAWLAGVTFSTIRPS